MKTEDYRAILMSALNRLQEIIDQRDELEVESAKLQQFITATINMLPEDKSEEFTDALSMVLAEKHIKSYSLTQAIRNALQDANRRWLTVAQVRDKLFASGFDFSGYTANPLASVSATLKRAKPEDVESGVQGGVTVYRWKGAIDPPARLPDLPKLSFLKPGDK